MKKWMVAVGLAAVLATTTPVCAQDAMLEAANRMQQMLDSYQPKTKVQADFKEQAHLQVTRIWACWTVANTVIKEDLNLGLLMRENCIGYMEQFSKFVADAKLN